MNKAILQSFRLTIALSIGFATLTAKIGLCVSPSDVYPEVPSSEVDTLLCYMQTTDSRILNLDGLCQGTSDAPVNPSVVIVEMNRYGDSLTGLVRNDTGQTVRYVIINYEIVNPSNQQSQTASFVFVNPETLKPGETGRFEGTLRELGEVRVTSLEWDSATEERSPQS